MMKLEHQLDAFPKAASMSLLTLGAKTKLDRRGCGGFVRRTQRIPDPKIRLNFGEISARRWLDPIAGG